MASSGPTFRALTRMADCRSALTDARIVSDPYLAGRGLRPSRNLLMMTGPEHDGLKRALVARLMPQRLRPLVPAIVVERDRLWRAVNAEGGDLIERFIEPLVRFSIFEVINVHPDDRMVLTEFLQGMPGVLDHSIAATSLPREHRSVLVAATVLRQRAAQGRTTGWGSFSDDIRKSVGVSKHLAEFNLPIILHGGYENPVNFLSVLAAKFLEDPEPFRQAGHTGWHDVANDVLCSAPPVRGLVRWAAADVPQTDVCAGDGLWIDIERANSELAQVTDATPHNRAGHLSFGYGAHACPGRHVTRVLTDLTVEALSSLPERRIAHLEARTTTDALTRRVRHLRLGSPDGRL